MISNKIKRNVWLTLAIMSTACIADRAIRVADGSLEWWNLVSAVIITALCTKFYLCYRRQVREGNIFGRVDVFQRYHKDANNL